MNYNSIQDALREAVHEHRLWPLKPEFDSDPIKRVMLLHPELHTLLKGSQNELRIGRLSADLEHFVKGGEVSVSVVPFEHKAAYMGILDPTGEGTWDIRSRDPSPGIRVFGRFASLDTFVALTWTLRSRSDPRWPSKRPLGDKNSTEYQSIRAEVEKRWSTLSLGHNHISGCNVSELLSDKYYSI